MRRAVLVLAVSVILGATTAGCELMITPLPSASPTSTRGSELPLPSIKDLGSPDPPATVQPIATP